MPQTDNGPRLLHVSVTRKPFGMDVRELWGSLRVVTVSPGSPAEAANVKRGYVLLAVDGTEVTPESWLEIYKAAAVPFDIVFDDRIDDRQRNNSIASSDSTLFPPPRGPEKDDPFGDGYEDFECEIQQRPFGMAANSDTPRLIARGVNLPRIEALLAGFPAEAAGVQRDDVLIAVSGCPVTTATWQLQAQLAPLPAKFQFRRRKKQQPGVKMP